MSDTPPNTLPWSAEKWQEFYNQSLLGLAKQLGLPETADIDAIAYELSILTESDRTNKPLPSRPLHCDYKLVSKQP